jgi:hypothetical protein
MWNGVANATQGPDEFWRTFLIGAHAQTRGYRC